MQQQAANTVHFQCNPLTVLSHSSIALFFSLFVFVFVDVSVVIKNGIDIPKKKYKLEVAARYEQITCTLFTMFTLFALLTLFKLFSLLLQHSHCLHYFYYIKHFTLSKQ